MIGELEGQMEHTNLQLKKLLKYFLSLQEEIENELTQKNLEIFRKQKLEESLEILKDNIDRLRFIWAEE